MEFPLWKQIWIWIISAVFLMLAVKKTVELAKFGCITLGQNSESLCKGPAAVNIGLFYIIGIAGLYIMTKSALQQYVKKRRKSSRARDRKSTSKN